MNEEQLKSAVRWLIATFGPLITSHGYIGSSQMEMIGGIILSAIPLIWSMVTHTQSNAVAIVATIASDPASPVKAPILENTIYGRALATEIKSANPGAVVAVAGTPAAATIAGIVCK